jgi:hypothetical protein
LKSKSREALYYAVFEPPIVPSFFIIKPLLSTLLSNTFDLCSYLNARDQVSNPYKTKGKIIILYIPIVTFQDSIREEKRF